MSSEEERLDYSMGYDIIQTWVSDKDSQTMLIEL